MGGPGDRAWRRHPAPGATAIGGAFDWKANQAPLLDAAGGDTTWVAQMAVDSTADGRTYYRAFDPGRRRARLHRGRRAGRDAVGGARAGSRPTRQLTLRWKGSEVRGAGRPGRPGDAAGARPRRLANPARCPSRWRATANLFGRWFTALRRLSSSGPISGSEDIDQPLAFGDPVRRRGRGVDRVSSPVVYAMPVAIATAAGQARRCRR